MRSILNYIIFSALLLVAVCCGKFRKIEKSPDWRVKFEGAMSYYNDKSYYKASVLFEQILPIVRGLPEGEKVQFYLAYCEFYERLYLLASEHFKTFYETYGRSAFAEEARYMYAYSLYAASPRYNLDQTNSIQGMAMMQEFLNRFPQSKFREQAIRVIQEIQEKLEKKGFENARQYYRMRYYEAAVVSLTNFAINFPDSKFREEAEFLMISAQYRWAGKSVPAKQSLRYKEAVKYYEEFIDKYPKSTFLSEAEKMYASSLEKIKTTKN